MNIKKHIPNFLTCCNLLCGCLGIIVTLELGDIYSGNLPFLQLASIFIFLAAVFDFFDGFVARLLKVASPIGKELDSLADVVSFGLLPGLIVYKLLGGGVSHLFEVAYYENYRYLNSPQDFDVFLFEYRWQLAFISLLIPIFSALRLAKFNIDTRQSESFIGVPTPANAILVASFPLILTHDHSSLMATIIIHPIFLIAYSLIMSLLLVAELPLFALKFKNFSWGDNKMKYILLVSSVVLLILLRWTAIPLIIFLYITLSIIENKFLKSRS